MRRRSRCGFRIRSSGDEADGQARPERSATQRVDHLSAAGPHNHRGMTSMTTVEDVGRFGASAGLLDRERIIAPAGFNRWLVPPAALCIHLCIGMAYGFSVFWLPLSRALGVAAPQVCTD